MQATMKHYHGPAAFPGFGNPYPHDLQLIPSGFAVPPDCRGLQNESIAPVTFPPEPENSFTEPHSPRSQDMRPALVGPTGQVHFLHTPSVSAPTPFVPMQPGFTEAASPLAHRTGRFTSDRLKRLDSGSYTGTSSHNHSLAPHITSSFDRLTLPSEMPIGSLVHLRLPPTWGVLKISNIPYSITKMEITQFLGRQARLITPDEGCPVHIIMERSTAKTMDCYVEFHAASDAKETADRVNKMYEAGCVPRLGNRYIDVELSSQDALLKDLFPHAKCISWKDGFPFAMPNTDSWSTGFTGFLTGEEVVGAIRHAEAPHRSPFCAKCPQRTYESSISTLYKFPWYATRLYTVHDRNLLFEMVNRQVKALVARINESNIVGLDQRLLCDLLKAGLDCPAFNERQKYSLCVNSEQLREIVKFDMGKWFPFDTLAKMPKCDELFLMYYAFLVSNGPVENSGTAELLNKFPIGSKLRSPYGSIWLEWQSEASKDKIWEIAVQQEMYLLRSLVLAGWTNVSKLGCLSRSDDAVSLTSEDPNETASLHSHTITRSNSSETMPSPYRADVFVTPSRRTRDIQTPNRSSAEVGDSVFNQRLFIRPLIRPQSRPFSHRNTLSSPTSLPSSGDPFFG